MMTMTMATSVPDEDGDEDVRGPAQGVAPFAVWLRMPLFTRLINPGEIALTTLDALLASNAVVAHVT